MVQHAIREGWIIRAYDLQLTFIPIITTHTTMRFRVPMRLDDVTVFDPVFLTTRTLEQFIGALLIELCFQFQ
jgi:hypothetical protein